MRTVIINPVIYTTFDKFTPIYMWPIKFLKPLAQALQKQGVLTAKWLKNSQAYTQAS